MRVDYHMHSEFSDDSDVLMEKQIERAIALDLDEICFTDHVDYGIKKDWDEGDIKWRGTGDFAASESGAAPLANVDYPRYFEKLGIMRDKYKDQIKIRSGLEFGVQSHTISKYEKLLEKYGNQLDFILLSVHQVEDKEFWTGDFMEGRSREEFNRRYYEEMLYLVKNFQNFDVLAHVDLISRYDPEGAYPFEKIRDILTEIFQIAIANGKGIEINTSSWHYGLPDTTPSKDILKLYRSLGGEIITVGSDAHKPEYLADHFEDAVSALKELGFEKIYTYKKHEAISHQL